MIAPYKSVELNAPEGGVAIDDYMITARLENGAVGMVTTRVVRKASGNRYDVVFAEGRIVLELPESWLKEL